MSEAGHKEIIRIEQLITGYGKKQVVNGISLSIASGEIFALIGHNGAGKSTLLKAVFGLIPIWRGKVFLDDKPVATPKPRDWIRAGIAYMLQGNRVFTDLTVAENLELSGITLPKKQQLKKRRELVFGLFPALKDRMKQRAGTLSSGEKQMLALGNTLVLSPRMLVLDEPSLGLAPPLISEALGCIKQISMDNGVTVLIVEQKVREVLKIADKVVVLRNGQVSFEGRADALKDEVKLKEVYL